MNWMNVNSSMGTAVAALEDGVVDLTELLGAATARKKTTATQEVDVEPKVLEEFREKKFLDFFVDFSRHF